MPVEVNEIEFATVPPTLFEVPENANELPVFALMPYRIMVPDAPRLVMEIPPMLLLFAVQLSTLKL